MSGDELMIVNCQECGAILLGRSMVSKDREEVYRASMEEWGHFPGFDRGKPGEPICMGCLLEGVRCFHPMGTQGNAAKLGKLRDSENEFED